MKAFILTNLFTMKTINVIEARAELTDPTVRNAIQRKSLSSISGIAGASIIFFRPPNDVVSKSKVRRLEAAYFAT
jgi:hypothetical protein